MNPRNLLKLYSDRVPLIQNILEHLDNNDIYIRPFSEFDNHALANVRLYMKKHNIKVPLSRDSLIRKAQRLYYGWIYGNTLYYRDGTSNMELLDTIIHEYVHWNRKQRKVFRYDTEKYIHREEYLANGVAKRVLKSL
jgi:hypothetical protein